MSSKISLFNKAIFKSDLKRLWWVMALEMLLLTMTCIIPTIDAYTYADFPQYWYNSLSYITVFSALTGALIFGYLHASAPCTTIHSYPITRTSLFITKALTGLTFCFLPLAVTAIILLAMAPGSNFSESAVITWIRVCFCYIVVLYSLCIIVNMMTGNSVASVIFTIGFAVLPFIFIEANEMLLRSELFGFVYKNTNILDKIYISVTDIEDSHFGWLYIIYSAVFFTAAYFLYRIRKLEANGEIIAFKCLTPLFIAIIVYLASILGYSYIVDGLDMGNIFTIVPFGALGALIAYMIAKKTLNIKKALLPAAVAAICCCLFAAVVEFDLTGYEKRIPDVKDVESVSISTPYHNNYFFQFDSNDLTYSKKDTIETVVKLHREIVDKYNTSKSYDVLYICYNLKNNRKLERRYRLPSDIPNEYMLRIYNTPEFKKSSSPIFNSVKRKNQMLVINDRRLATGTTITSDSPYFEALHEAMKKDILAAPGKYFLEPKTASTYITASWYEDVDPKYGNPYIETMFYADKYAVNTSKVLKKIINEDAIPVAEDIERIEVYSYNKSGKNETVITDKEKISEIYELYDDIITYENHYSRDNGTNSISFTFVMKNGHTFTINANYPTEKLPDALYEFIR